MDHKWKQLIFGVIFLFGFIVNETFILDSHQPFICSVAPYSDGVVKSCPPEYTGLVSCKIELSFLGRSCWLEGIVL
jgi:hypothetical protein